MNSTDIETPDDIKKENPSDEENSQTKETSQQETGASSAEKKDETEKGSEENIDNNTEEDTSKEGDKTSPESNSFIVCMGATCLCSEGVPMPIPLKVQKQNKVILSESKLVAIVTDNEFETPAAPFGSCKKNPKSGKPCEYKPTSIWKWNPDVGDKHPEINGQKILTAGAFIQCPIFGGKITIEYHGQTLDAPNNAAEDIDESLQFAIICFANKIEDLEDDDIKQANVNGLSIEGTNFMADKNKLQEAILRVGKSYKFIASYDTKNDPSDQKYYCFWYLKGHTDKDKPTKIIFDPKEGTLYKLESNEIVVGIQKPGKYYIGCFGYLFVRKKEKEVLFKESTILLNVQENELKDITISPKQKSIVGDNGAKDPLYVLWTSDEPYKIKLNTLFEPTEKELETISIEIKDNQKNLMKRYSLQVLKQTEGASFEKNATYEIEKKDTILTDLSSDLTFLLWAQKEGRYHITVNGFGQEKEIVFESVDNDLDRKLKAENVPEKGMIRPGTSVKFIANPLKDKNIDKIKWYIDDKEIEGASGLTFEQTFSKERKYNVKASISQLFGTPTTDNYTLKVQSQSVESITSLPKQIDSLGIGTSVRFEAITTYNDIQDKESIVWTIKTIKSDIKDKIPTATAPLVITSTDRFVKNENENVITIGETNNKSNVLEVQFNQIGEFELVAKSGNTKESKPIKIKVIKSHIEEWCFADSEGSQRKNIGWKQKFYLHIKAKGLDQHKFKIQMWHDLFTKKEEDKGKEQFVKIASKDLDGKTFALKDGVLDIGVSGGDFWKSVEDSVVINTLFPNYEKSLLFTLFDIETLCDNARTYGKGHDLEGHLFPDKTEYTYGKIPLNNKIRGLFLDEQNRELNEIVAYTYGAKIKLSYEAKLKNDIKNKKFILTVYENQKGEDKAMYDEVFSFDDEGRYLVPVAMDKLEKQKPAGLDKYRSRFFYFHLYEEDGSKKGERLYSYPEGYKTEKNNDQEMIDLKDDTIKASDIQDYTIIKPDFYTFTTSDTSSLLAPMARPQIQSFIVKQKGPIEQTIDEGKQKEQVAKNTNANAVAHNQTALGRLFYRQQLKVAEDPSRQQQSYGRVPLKIGTYLEFGDCKNKYCITRQNYLNYEYGTQENVGKLIQEINIRLAGFGGNVPTKDFDDRTENAIKQFERDYMGKSTPTGKICGSLLQAIDEFTTEYPIPKNIWSKRKDKNIDSEMLCPCGKCDGFGKGRFKGIYFNNSIFEKDHRYEYPGIHRSLLWALKSIFFYLEREQLTYRFKLVESGYRCYDRNIQKNRNSTNHAGKALDLHFKNEKGVTITSVKAIEDIRTKIFKKYLGAQYDWLRKNIFNLESAAVGATTWIHYDVREYDKKYLIDSFFSKNDNEFHPNELLDFSNKLDFNHLCNCRNRQIKEKVSECVTCKVFSSMSSGSNRESFYKNFGTLAINKIKTVNKSNKFKGLYMIAQRRVENGFNEVVIGNNPMNLKGKGDKGQVSMKTKEWIDGIETILEKEKFANFSSNEAGFEKYFEYLKTNWKESYIALFDDNKTITDFAEGLMPSLELKRLGYATHPEYDKRVIEDFTSTKANYIKWYECMLTCENHTNKEAIQKDLELLNGLK